MTGLSELEKQILNDSKEKDGKRRRRTGGWVRSAVIVVGGADRSSVVADQQLGLMTVFSRDRASDVDILIAEMATGI
jgi:hypothetical protein